MTFGRNNSQIDHLSSAAICDEIGDRLRLILKRTASQLPQHMMNLVKRMAIHERISRRLSPKQSRP
jgi:hypothetical protein